MIKWLKTQTDGWRDISVNPINFVQTAQPLFTKDTYKITLEAYNPVIQSYDNSKNGGTITVDPALVMS